MPRNNSITWNIADPITAVRLNAFNSDLDDLYLNGSDRGKVFLAISALALRVDIGAFNYRVGSGQGAFAGTTDLLLIDNTINYVMIDPTGVIITNTTGYDSANARLAKVTTSGGAITAIDIGKNDVVDGPLGGGQSEFFGVYLNQDVTIAGGVDTLLTWTGVLVNDNLNFDTTGNSDYTAPFDGDYVFGLNLHTESNESPSIIGLYNSSNILYPSQSIGVTTGSAQSSGLFTKIALSAGNVVRARVTFGGVAVPAATSNFYGYKV